MSLYDDPSQALVEKLPPVDDKMRNLILQLPKKSKLYTVARDILTANVKERFAVQPFLEALQKPAKRSWKERCVAAWALGRVEIPEAEKQQVAYALEEVMIDRAKEDRLARGCSRSFNLGGVAALIIMVNALVSLFKLSPIAFLLALLLGTMVLAFVLGLLLGPLVTTISLIYDKACDEKIRIEAAGTLGALGYPESVTNLAHTFAHSSGNLRKAAQESLRSVAEHLTPEHYRTIHPTTGRILTDALGKNSETFDLFLIETIGKVGGGSAVEPVERFIKGETRPEVRAAAVSLLPVLRDRQLREKQAENLLRPSHSPESPGEVLLRPAGSGSESDSNVLLRSSGPNEPSEPDESSIHLGQPP